MLSEPLLKEGSWVPEDWNYTFIYPGVKTEYNYITAVSADVTFIRVEGSFSYERLGSSLFLTGVGCALPPRAFASTTGNALGITPPAS